MNDKRVQIWIALVAGLALAGLLLLAGRVAASPSPPVTSDTQFHAVHVTDGWGSPWVPINQGETITFTHDLGGDQDDYAVELWFLDTDDGLGINHRAYGGLEFNGNWYGAHWQNLTANTIQVYRQPNDNAADLIRIRVWVPPTAPDYDSGWLNMQQGQTITFSHNLGITSTDLTVGLWFSGTARGIHHYGFGGLAVDGPQYLLGAHWHNLTDSSVQVTRHDNDTDVEQVRVIVVHGDLPDYDSLVALGGWQSIAQGTVFTFTHNLNWNPSMMLVGVECYDPIVGGINLWLAGGNAKGWGVPPNRGAKGANLQNLTANTVEVYRWPQDDVCPEARVRIWKRSARVYLPLVLSDYAPPLAYDDGTAESYQSSATLDSGFAVRFTAPGASAQLVGARYYLNAAEDNHPIQVHVWDTDHVDLITPFTATPPAGTGWFDVDLSGHNLTVSGDFYVGFLYSEQHSDPSLGVDTSSPDGCSYEVPWIEMTGLDYMIRAVATPQ
jgi:hypothetical protein